MGSAASQVRKAYHTLIFEIRSGDVIATLGRAAPLRASLPCRPAWRGMPADGRRRVVMRG